MLKEVGCGSSTPPPGDGAISNRQIGTGDNNNSDGSLGCGGCGREIAERWYLRAADRAWHCGCLRCCHCRVPLAAELTCFARDGNIYCKEDYYRLVVVVVRGFQTERVILEIFASISLSIFNPVRNKADAGYSSGSFMSNYRDERWGLMQDSLVPVSPGTGAHGFPFPVFIGVSANLHRSVRSASKLRPDHTKCLLMANSKPGWLGSRTGI